MKDIKVLEHTLKQKKLHPALDKEGNPILVTSKTITGLKYTSVNTHVKLLKERGIAIDPETLKVIMRDGKRIKTPPKPKPKPETETTTPEPKTEDKTAEEKTIEKTTTDQVQPLKMETYTKAELTKIGKPRDGYKCLQKIAGADPDIPGNVSKATLITTLTGRPKFPLTK